MLSKVPWGDERAFKGAGERARHPRAGTTAGSCGAARGVRACSRRGSSRTSGRCPPKPSGLPTSTTRGQGRAYQIDIREFMQFVGIMKPEGFLGVTRAHVIAWRKDLERRVLSGGRASGASSRGKSIHSGWMRRLSCRIISVVSAVLERRTPGSIPSRLSVIIIAASR